MNRSNFLNILAQSINHLPQEEQNDILFDYEEHFRIGLAQGKTEEDIADSLGNPEAIASQYGSRAIVVSSKPHKKNILYLSVLTGFIFLLI